MSRTKILSLVAAGLMAVPVWAQTTTVPQRPHSTTLRRPASLGYLGIGVVDLTDERARALNLKNDRGVEIKHVNENSPASKAGLKENDVILEVNGKSIDDIEQFQTTIAETQPGTKVSLTIWREGAKQTLTATLGGRSENPAFGGLDLPNPPMPPMPAFPLPYGNQQFPGFPADAPAVGFIGAGLNPQIAEFFGVKEGVLVWEVEPKTPGERAGLKAGDIVVKVNGTPVTNPREITGLVRMSGKKTVVFTVVRNKKEMTLNVEVSDSRQSPPEREVL
jgi:serine protease Do